jgi:hypothetical protein
MKTSSCLLFFYGTWARLPRETDKSEEKHREMRDAYSVKFRGWFDWEWKDVARFV